MSAVGSHSLSIVIPSYSRADLLRVCLARLDECQPAGTEIIVVDDASCDNAVSLEASRFPGVKILRQHERGGFAKAVNAGIRAATGDIVELLNDDAEVQTGWAEPALRHFDDPTVASVAPRILAGPTGDRIDSAGDGYHLAGVARKRGKGFAIDDPRVSQPREILGANGTAGFFRRSALFEVGLLDESFGSYFEDVDLAIRLRRAGYIAKYEPASLVIHQVSASFGPPARWLLAMQSRNEERLFWRHAPASALPWLLPLHLAVLAGKAWRRLRERQLSAWLSGRWSALREMPEMFRQRSALARAEKNPGWRQWMVDAGWPWSQDI